MKNFQDLLDKQYDPDEYEPEPSSEFASKERKCDAIFETLKETLNQEQWQLLDNLSMEYRLLCDISRVDGYIDGSERGVKLALRLLVESLTDN